MKKTSYDLERTTSLEASCYDLERSPGLKKMGGDRRATVSVNLQFTATIFVARFERMSIFPC